MIYKYCAFQLVIHSELYFPELLDDLSGTSKAHDVLISFGNVDSKGLAQPLKRGLFYQAMSQALWLTVPNVARFLITDGNHITIDPFPGIDEESIRLFLLGSCMGALLMQRDLFLVHGNAIKIGNHCISFVGHSGIGKSTLSGAFFKRGYSILADDVCAINQLGHVQPSFPQIKLWFDAAKHLDIETEALRRIRPSIEKFAVPLGSQFHLTSLSLKVVYILNSHNKDEFVFTDLSGMKKLKPLQLNTYRKSYLKGMLKEKSYFKQCGKIASQISLVNIVRPQDGFKLDTLVDLIEADVKDRGLVDVG